MAYTPPKLSPSSWPDSYQTIFKRELFYVFQETILNYEDTVYGSFTGTDNMDKLNESLKKMPDDWVYRNLKVKIKRNKYGYRAEEFENVDWTRSIVLFGCSNTYGVGLSDEHTIGEQITQMTGIPTVNLATPGSSPLFNVHNAMMLRESYPAPLAVVYVWPENARTIFQHKGKHRIHSGPWMTKEIKTEDHIPHAECYLSWLKIEEAPRLQGSLLQLQARQLWYGTSTKVIECSFMPQLPGVHTVGIDKDWEEKASKGIIVKGFIDRARDLTHPGIESAKNAAEVIVSNLKL